MAAGARKAAHSTMVVRWRQRKQLATMRRIVRDTTRTVDNYIDWAGVSRVERSHNAKSVDNMQEAVSLLELDSETIAESVFRRIQGAIVRGEIAPGSKISEPELARTYGVSRGPLREAIHRLEGQRLLVRVPHVGARVVSLSQAELIELYDIRESLEGMACRLAATRMSVAEVDELRRVLDTHERDPGFQAGVGYYQQEGDFDFHYRIIQGSGNRTLAQLLCGELYQLVRMYRIRFSTTPNRPRHAFAEHHRILDAIAERDGELAELLMRRHIAGSRRNVERQLAQAGCEQFQRGDS